MSALPAALSFLQLRKLFKQPIRQYGEAAVAVPVQPMYWRGVRDCQTMPGAGDCVERDAPVVRGQTLGETRAINRCGNQQVTSAKKGQHRNANSRKYRTRIIEHIEPCIFSLFLSLLV